MRHPPYLLRFSTLPHLSWCCKPRRAVIGFCTFALFVSAAPIQAGAQDWLSQLLGPRILESPRREPQDGPRSLFGGPRRRFRVLDGAMLEIEGAAVKVDHCTIVISQSSNRKILERAFNRRGHAYMALGRFVDAANDFTAVIRMNSKIAGYFDNRQNAYREMGRLDDALNDANRAVRLAPTYAFAYGGRGNVFADLGRYDLEIDDYTKAISLDSKNGGLFLDRGKLFVRAGQLSYPNVWGNVTSDALPRRPAFDRSRPICPQRSVL